MCSLPNVELMNSVFSIYTLLYCSRRLLWKHRTSLSLRTMKFKRYYDQPDSSILISDFVPFLSNLLSFSIRVSCDSEKMNTKEKKKKGTNVIFGNNRICDITVRKFYMKIVESVQHVNQSWRFIFAHLCNKRTLKRHCWLSFGNVSCVFWLLR